MIAEREYHRLSRTSVRGQLGAIFITMVLACFGLFLSLFTAFSFDLLAHPQGSLEDPGGRFGVSSQL